MAEKARERAFQRMLEHAAAAGGNGRVNRDEPTFFFSFLFETMEYGWLLVLDRFNEANLT